MHWSTHTSRCTRCQHDQERSHAGKTLTSSTEGQPEVTGKHYHQLPPEGPLEAAQTVNGQEMERKPMAHPGITVITVHQWAIEVTAALLLAHMILEGPRDAQHGEMIGGQRRDTKTDILLQVKWLDEALERQLIPTFPAMMMAGATISAQGSVTSHLEGMIGAHETIAETDMAIATTTENTSIRIDLRWIETAAVTGGLAAAAVVRREKSIRATTGHEIARSEITIDGEGREGPRHCVRCRHGEYTGNTLAL